MHPQVLLFAADWQMGHRKQLMAVVLLEESVEEGVKNLTDSC